MNAIRELLNDLEKYDNSPEGRGCDLRLGLADIILRHLRKTGWSQNRLAAEAGMKPQQITRLIHAASNFTADTAGRILFALGTTATLVEEPPQKAAHARLPEKKPKPRRKAQ